jgi:hypothetical protein
MRVRCIAELPTEEQARTLGNHYRQDKQVFHVTVGCEYLVYALTFMDGALWIELKEEFGYLHRAPLCLFEIADGRVSSYWEVRWRNQDLCLWPTSFYREYYFDDLIEGFPEVLDDFRQVSVSMESEVK